MNCKEPDHYTLVPKFLPGAQNQHKINLCWVTNPYEDWPGDSLAVLEHLLPPSLGLVCCRNLTFLFWELTKISPFSGPLCLFPFPTSSHG